MLMKTGFLTILLSAALMAACSSDHTVRIMTYNVGVFDKYEESGIENTASFIREMCPDVLILNEVDSCAARTGFCNQLDELCQASGSYNGLFAPALAGFQGGAYGIAQMWREERMPVSSFSVRLPKGDGSEPRSLVVVEYEDMVVAGTHLEHMSKEAQMAQAEIITDTLISKFGSAGKPVFLCGDFNSMPDAPTLDYLRRHWDVLSPESATYPDADSLSRMRTLPQEACDVPGKCIDYIMILKGSAEYETAAAEVCVRSESGSLLSASDHLPVFVEVRLK